jgi:hypothetical protein
MIKMAAILMTQAVARVQAIPELAQVPELAAAENCRLLTLIVIARSDSDVAIL